MRLNRFATLAAAALTVAFAAQSASAVTIGATGWNVDFILGSGETYAAHAKPENSNIWFAQDSSVGVLGLPASGAVTAGGVNFQLQPYTGGTSNVMRSTATMNTLALTAPAKYSSINLLGSNTGAANGLTWQLTLNFSDGPSSGPIDYANFTNWAGGTSDVLPNPQLTSNGTSASFVGTLTTRSLDLTALGFSNFTLSSISFSNGNSAGGNLAIFALAGEPTAAAAVPEPATASLALVGLAGLMMRRRRNAVA